MKRTLAQLLGYEPFTSKGKLAYLKLNIPTPCPPPSAVLVHQERGISPFTRNIRIVPPCGIRDATAPVMFPIFTRLTSKSQGQVTNKLDATVEG
jgi:hypothetical protein